MNINDLVRIKEKNYMIFSKCNLYDNDYFYLIEVNNPSNKKYCKFKKKKAIFIDDICFIQELMPLFIENVKLHYDVCR